MKINLALAGTILAFSVVSGISFQRLVIHKVIIDIKPNPYVQSMAVEITGEHNDTLTIKLPIETMVPDDLIVSNQITFNGVEILPMSGELCNLFNDKMFAPDVLDAGRPLDIFPKQCPIRPGNYSIVDLQFELGKRIPGLPDGDVISVIYVSLNDDDDSYIIKIHAESSIETTVPMMG